MTPEESLKLMKQASRDFYLQATRTGCHAFIEQKLECIYQAKIQLLNATKDFT